MSTIAPDSPEQTSSTTDYAESRSGFARSGKPKTSA